MEASIVQINITGTNPLILVSSYFRPGKRLPVVDLENILSLGAHVILAGDLNARHISWNNPNNNRLGIELNSWAQRARIKILAPDTPTRCSTRQHYSNSIIDLALLRNIPYRCSVSTIADLNSDHYPVLLSLDLQNLNINCREQFSVNWDNVKHYLEHNFSPSLKITSTNDIENSLISLEKTLLEAVRVASKPKKIRPPDYQFLSDEVRAKIQNRNRLRRLWQRTRDPSIRTELRSLQNEIKRAIFEHRQSKWEDHLESLDPSDNSLWRAVSRLRKTKRDIPPLNGHTAITHEEKAEALASHFSNQFTPNHDVGDDTFIRHVTTEVERYLNCPVTNSVRYTTPSEIAGFIRKMKVGKAPGIDGISNRIIKNAPLSVVFQLCFIFNKMLDLRYFPNQWKTAVIVPIPKPGLKPDTPVNFRPISLLSSVSKIFEFVLLSRLRDYCQTHSIIINEQFGFRPQHSTQHQLLRVVEFVHASARKTEVSAAIFLDVAKAFDRVWIPGLIYKLMRIGLPQHQIHLINSYLTNRFFRVRVDTFLSAPRSINAGVPQGSLISPFLFSLYVNDVPQLPNIVLALYADDTAVFSRHRSFDGLFENFQRYIPLLERWLVNWRIKINASKSAFLPFLVSPRPHIPQFDLKIFGEPIPWVQNYKYLGLILDQRLTWRDQIQAANRKLVVAKAQLKHLLARKSRLTVRNKLLLYKTVLRPIMLYGSAVWGSAAKSHLQTLQVAQNHILRTIIDFPRWVTREVFHSDLKIPPVFDFIKKDAFRFYRKIKFIPNAALHRMEDYNLFDPKHRKRPKAVLGRTVDPFPRPKRRRVSPEPD